MRLEGKQSPAGLWHKTPTPCTVGSAGHPPIRGPVGFLHTSPIPVSHHHTHLEETLPRWGAAPMRWCQAAASPENSHPTNRTARKETEPQAGSHQRCPLCPQGCSHRGNKTPPPHQEMSHTAHGEWRHQQGQKVLLETTPLTDPPLTWRGEHLPKKGAHPGGHSPQPRPRATLARVKVSWKGRSQ